MQPAARKKRDIAILLPDPVIRVFVQHFDEFPRSLRKRSHAALEAEEERAVSKWRNADFLHAAGAKRGRVDVVTALGRLRIIASTRHCRAFGSYGRCCLEFVLARSPCLMIAAQLCWPAFRYALTTAIVRDGVLCGYRCTELPAKGAALTPQMLLEEIYPVAAYYQDTWQKESKGAVAG